MSSVNFYFKIRSKFSYFQILLVKKNRKSVRFWLNGKKLLKTKKLTNQNSLISDILSDPNWTFVPFLKPSWLAIHIFFITYFVCFVVSQLGEFPFVNGLYWKMHGKHKLGQCNPTFQRLKKILVKGFKFETVELEMLGFFLKKAKFLESVALVPSKNCRSKGFSQAKYQITDQLFRAWRASPNAKVRIFKSIQMTKSWTF